MKRNSSFLFLVILFLSCHLPVFSDISIIPKPLKIIEKDGSFKLSPDYTIAYDSESGPYAIYLQEALSAPTGWDLNVSENGIGDIILKIDSISFSKPESYRLEVTPNNVMITGSDRGGLFYGIQSFMQLLPSEIYSDKRIKGVEWKAPAVVIEDTPGRPWRGMLLDVARYFHDKEYVKHFIDMMAMYKMNKLQFHLIDDSGWRLESKKYPLLTEKGSYAGDKEDRMGGFYTRDDIKELLEYADLRNIEIIPEIEFPAHILSAIVAYPWLSCRDIQLELPREHFISADLLCVGKDSSIKFLEDILDETIELFPSHYINIGGDEAVYDRWKECSNCLRLMEKEGIKDPSHLQGWLTDSVARMMASRGREIIGWDEIIMRGNVSTPVTVTTWHNPEDTLVAQKGGHKSILTLSTHSYFDFPESSTPGEVKAATWLPPISLEKSYAVPVNDYSSGSTVIGVQGCLWSDQFIIGDKLQEITPLNENRSEAYIDYLTFPRMAALSEVGWSNKSNRDYSDFLKRMSSHYTKLSYGGIGFRMPEPIIEEIVTNPDGSFDIKMSSPMENAEIVYTTDGSYPTNHSSVYNSGDFITIPSLDDFRASTMIGKRRLSLPVIINPDK